MSYIYVQTRFNLTIFKNEHLLEGRRSESDRRWLRAKVEAPLVAERSVETGS
jgi:hypothetical protein